MIQKYFLLSLKNLRGKKLRSWLTILGILIGVSAVVSLILLGSGLKNAIMGQFGILSVDKLAVQNKGTGFGPPGSTVVEKLNEQDLKIIEEVRGTKEVVTRLIRVVEIEYNNIARFGYVADIPNKKEEIKVLYDSFNAKTLEGRLLEEDDSGKVLIGSDIARGSGFEKPIKVGNKIKLNKKEFEVVGILEKSSNFQINSIYLVSNRDLEDLLGIKNEFDLIIVQVEDPNQIKEISEVIEEKLRRARNEKVGKESFSVQTPLQALGSVNTILNIVNLIVVGIAAISLFVGGVGIANTMYTSVLERTKEIGVMKAIGARNSDILWIFLIESGLLGLMGGFIGSLIGLGSAIGISKVVNNLLGTNIFVISVSYSILLGAIGFSFLIGVISGVLPALQASKTNVAEALREH